jgi:excisionase family DNA binding protein
VPKGEERLSLREAADALGVSEVTARRWVKAGKLKAHQPGRKYLIPSSAVDDLLESDSGKGGRRSSPEPKLFNGLEEEQRRTPIDYNTCRAALEGFCDHWQPALSGKRRLEYQGFQDFKASAASLSRLTRELMGAEMTELGQPYDEEGDPVFYTERSEFGPAIVRFQDIAIRMDRIGKELFGEDLTSDPEMGQLINIFPKAS